MIVTAADIVRLRELLSLESIAKTSMSVSMVDGFVTACLIGPEIVAPVDFLPWIWDIEKGQAEPSELSPDDLNDFQRIVFAMQNRVAAGLNQERPTFQPLFATHSSLSPQDWVHGLEVAASFEPDQWDAAIDDEPELVAPFAALDHPEARGASSSEWPQLMEELEAGVVGLRDYFRLPLEEDVPVQPYVRQGPKVGRNDPCPCGSGKKYKHCCGVTH